jgi:hypothetical protein
MCFRTGIVTDTSHSDMVDFVGLMIVCAQR